MPNNSSHKSNLTKFIVLLSIIVGCWLLGRFFHFDETYFREYLSQFPIALSIIIFIGLYIGLTFFVWFTKDLLMIAGIVLFGLWGSSFLIWIAEAINAVILFVMSRKLGRDFVKEKTGGKFNDFDQRMGDVSFLDLFLLRLIILVPFRYLDMGLGLTKVSLKKYMTAVLTGSPLRILMRQYFVLLFIQMFRDDPMAIVQYATEHSYLSIFSFAYLGAMIFLFWRVKKLIWG